MIVTSSAGCSNTIDKPVVVLPAPNADIWIDNTCFNAQPVVLNNYSTPGDSALSMTYFWTLGDGNTSVARSPSHVYADSGNYRATLIINNGFCADTATQVFNVMPVPFADYTLPTFDYCKAPQTVNFSNTSVGGIAFVWYFGNGDTSNLRNPSEAYGVVGDYNAELVSINTYGCRDTTSNIIHVNPPPVISAVDVTPLSGCAPFPITALVHASNANDYRWYFGDADAPYNSPATSQVHIYSDTGIFSIWVIAFSNKNCSDTMLLRDTVISHPSPFADFAYYTADTIPAAGSQINCINASQFAYLYDWNFGDGGTSDAVDPIHRYLQGGNYEIRLIAQNWYGCADTAYKNIHISNGALYVPNAFAPEFTGGSELVRVWKPAGFGLQSYHAYIYNTYGELLWDSDKLQDTEPLEGWDGTYKGVLMQQDVYVWKIEAVFQDGSHWSGMNYKNTGVKKTIGDVTLIR